MPLKPSTPIENLANKNSSQMTFRNYRDFLAVV